MSPRCQAVVDGKWLHVRRTASRPRPRVQRPTASLRPVEPDGPSRVDPGPEPTVTRLQLPAPPTTVRLRSLASGPAPGSHGPRVKAKRLGGHWAHRGLATVRQLPLLTPMALPGPRSFRGTSATLSSPPRELPVQPPAPPGTATLAALTPPGLVRSLSSDGGPDSRPVSTARTSVELGTPTRSQPPRENTLGASRVSSPPLHPPAVPPLGLSFLVRKMG